MKTIILLRHGKSDCSASYGSDHERPLAPRGEQAAQTIGRLLARVGQIPDRVLTSSAVRARETVELAVAAGDWNCPVQIVPEFYGASPESVIERVRREDDGPSSLLIAGHQPTWSTLAGELMGGGMLRFPTAAMARIDLDIKSWSELDRDRGLLVWFLIPRLLAPAGL